MGKSVTVGYRYFMGLHMALCHGPVDRILEIKVGDRTAIAGNYTPDSWPGVYISQPFLFGGEEREGGIQGGVDFLWGTSTQAPNDYLASKQGGTQPAYRGITGLVYRAGLVACNNPYLKPWAVRLSRILRGWSGNVWYSEKATVTPPNTAAAMNPAHIVYECLTNPEWGMGYSPAQISDASFRAAADTFFAEGLGLCIMWTQQQPIETFVQSIMDHVGAVMGQNRRTGLFELRPIRGGYNVDALSVFGPSNVIAVDSFERAATTESVNEMTVRFVDAATGKVGAVTVQNLAQITSQGGVVSQTVNYPGLPNVDLATRAGLRDLRAVSTPIARVRMRVNRQGYSLLPGDLIRFTWPKLGIANMVLRVLDVDLGTLTSSEIAIEAAEDVFGMPASTYVAQQPSAWQDPATDPAPVQNRLVTEAPYWELSRTLSTADLAALPSDAGFLWIAAARPSGDSINYQILSRTGSAAFTQTGAGEFAPTATLAAGIGPAATTATLSNLVDAELITVGTFATLGDEIVRIDALNTTTGAVTIGRGVMDTTAKTHAAGARLFFADEFAATDDVERVDGEGVQVRLLPSTGRGTLAESSAPIDTVVMDQRHFRPYPPGRLRIAGQAYPAQLIDVAITVTWSHRNRLQQNLEGDESGSIGPEAGTTYTARLINVATGATVQTITGITGTSADFGSPSGLFRFRVEVWSVRGGLESRQRHSFEFDYENISVRVTESGDRRITEESDRRIGE